MEQKVMHCKSSPSIQEVNIAEDLARTEALVPF